MEWFNKFNVGQKVTVVKKVIRWKYGGVSTGWNSSEMDETIGKTYKINVIDEYGYRLNTSIELGSDYYYPVESLACVKGTQLLFNFMNEE